jgi:hypothetical protein
MGVAHHALRGELINGIESTLACPGTTLEHTAFFLVRTSIVIVIVNRRRLAVSRALELERRICRLLLLLCTLSLSLSFLLVATRCTLSFSLSLIPTEPVQRMRTLLLISRHKCECLCCPEPLCRYKGEYTFCYVASLLPSPLPSPGGQYVE